MIAETIGKTLAEVGELPLGELSAWENWYAFKAEQRKKADRAARRKGRR